MGRSIDGKSVPRSIAPAESGGTRHAQVGFDDRCERSPCSSGRRRSAAWNDRPMSVPADPSAQGGARPPGFRERWLPGRSTIWLLVIVLIAVTFLWFGRPLYLGKERSCPIPEKLGDPQPEAMIGNPPADATLHAKLGLSRGKAITTTSWPSGPGAPDATSKVRSSPLIRSVDGSVIRPESIEAALEINAGITFITVCIDDKQISDELAHGRYNGYVIIPTTDPEKPLTVRQQLSVQSAYVVVFWALPFVMVPLALAVASKKLSAQSKPARWIIALTGAGACLATFRATAASNITWGGLDDVGSLIVATFTATTGAVATATAATGHEEEGTR